jgi:hypothetical protein
MFPPFHQNGMQGPIEVIAGAKRATLRRIQGIKNRCWPHGQAGTAQDPGKMHDVGGELS